MIRKTLQNIFAAEIPRKSYLTIVEQLLPGLYSCVDSAGRRHTAASVARYIPGQRVVVQGGLIIDRSHSTAPPTRTYEV